MEWEKLLNSKKLGGREPHEDGKRTPFNSDHDKIIFSGAFRRLAKKTQVHPLATNDHIHNRLTHSLEVACVGRSLGINVGYALEAEGLLPENITGVDLGDIVQSACLAHDIGNPPFGHTGEAAIRNWFEHDGKDYLSAISEEEKADFLYFEGNAQGLRVLTSLEYHPHDHGMRLTYATLGSFVKYPWTSLPTMEGSRPKTDKYGIYQSEVKIFKEVAKAVGLKEMGNDWYSRHPLVYLMEAADDFCYGILDLEDGLEMDILKWDEVLQILEPALDSTDKKFFESDLKHISDRGKPALIRGRIISAYIKDATEAFINNEKSIRDGSLAAKDLISLCSSNINKSVQDAKNTAKEKIFPHPRKVELEIGSYHVISTLLEVMCKAAIEWVNNPKKMSFRSKRVIDLIGEETLKHRIEKSGCQSREYLVIMRIIDFISGMTDNYATYLAKQFNGMGEIR
jgi:dGTPase